MRSPSKILIIRLSSIGDILLATPFLRQTRIKFPDAVIDFVIKERFIDLVQYNPHVNRIFSVNEKEGLHGLLELRKLLIANNYDYVFDLHNNFRSRILTYGMRAHISRIHKDKIKRALLVYTKINLYKQVTPIPLRYLKVGEKAGIKDDFNGLEIFWKNHIEEGLSLVVDTKLLRKPFVVVAPGAGFKTKQWPVEYFRELIETIEKKHGLPIVILGSKEEEERFRLLEISDAVHNLAGKLTLLESAIILSKAQAVISNDSGLMHMATAVKVPVLAIFGSTVKEFGFFPFRAQSNVIENKKLWCRPCSHIGRNHCPLIHFKCMKDLKPMMVYDQLKPWL